MSTVAAPPPRRTVLRFWLPLSVIVLLVALRGMINIVQQGQVGVRWAIRDGIGLLARRAGGRGVCGNQEGTAAARAGEGDRHGGLTSSGEGQKPGKHDNVVGSGRRWDDEL